MIDRSAKCRRVTTTTLRGKILIFQKIRSTVFAAEEETSNSGEGTLLEEIVCGEADACFVITMKSFPFSYFMHFIGFFLSQMINHSMEI